MVYWEQFRRIDAGERSDIFRCWDQRYQDTFFQRFNLLRNPNAKRAEVYVACLVMPRSRRIAVEAVFQKRMHGLYEEIRKETRERVWIFRLSGMHPQLGYNRDLGPSPDSQGSGVGSPG